ncbi:hypothetical protein HRbin11_00253 [bacterium HR11]|mgnify:CR=1 FL=1|nr:hypothetical protein HRbin11_00253 [bacterium HR11]
METMLKKDTLVDLFENPYFQEVLDQALRQIVALRSDRRPFQLLIEFLQSANIDFDWEQFQALAQRNARWYLVNSEPFLKELAATLEEMQGCKNSWTSMNCAVVLSGGTPKLEVSARSGLREIFTMRDNFDNWLRFVNNILETMASTLNQQVWMPSEAEQLVTWDELLNQTEQWLEAIKSALQQWHNRYNSKQ